MTLAEVCAALLLDAAPGCESTMVEGVCSDSREAGPGQLFVCIVGENMDGHDYAAKAVQGGAVAVLASKPLPALSVPVLVVADTIRGLGALAHHWRCRFQGKVVGVTGTAGKTTVKEVLAQVLSVRGVTARNPLNLNNQIGMPLSILATTGQEDFWVFEVGISQPQDMDELGPVLNPDVALVLNAGAGHTAGLGSKGVAWHKARLLAHVRREGTALVCSDYPELVREARVICPQSSFFTITGRPVPYRASYGGPSPDGEAEKGMYRLWLDGQSLDVIAPFRGEYGAENVIAIAAVAQVLGLSTAEIHQGFAEAVLPKQRFQLRKYGAWSVIDDSYNANPLSMKRMLEAAHDMAGAAPLYAVLGEMKELGDVAEVEHEKLGQWIAQHKVQALFWKGGHWEGVRFGLTKEKFSGLHYAVQDEQEFWQCWEDAGLKPGVVLFKGSRSNQLESLVRILTEGLTGEGEHVL